MQRQRPSRTAYKVALNILTLGSIPEMSTVLPDGTADATARLLVASGAATERTVSWARSRWSAIIYRAFDWMMPGQFKAFAYRKAFFEQQVRESLAAGATQVLLLGAGYDTLSWRLAQEFPLVTFFEIDHPYSSHLKAEGIKAMGTPPNLNLIAEDLSNRRLVEILADRKDWNVSASTIIVAEGLLQYLTSEEVRDVFIECASISISSRFAFTYIPSRRDGKPDAGPCTGFVLMILRLTGEPWQWSIKPKELEAFVATLGWKYSPGLLRTPANHGVELYAVATHGS